MMQNMCKLASLPVQIRTLAKQRLHSERNRQKKNSSLCPSFCSFLLGLLKFAFHACTKAAPVTVLSLADAVIS